MNSEFIFGDKRAGCVEGFHQCVKVSEQQPDLNKEFNDHKLKPANLEIPCLHKTAGINEVKGTKIR